MRTLLLLSVLLTACNSPMPAFDGGTPDAETVTPDAGTDAGPAACVNARDAYVCAHDNSCCRVPCTDTYECPDAMYARDVDCLCEAFRCPGPGLTCVTFTLDRRTECPCTP